MLSAAVASLAFFLHKHAIVSLLLQIPGYKGPSPVKTADKGLGGMRPKSNSAVKP
jgi:hypothetical protein